MSNPLSDSVWIPAFAGMTKEGAGMTKGGAGMTRGGAGMTNAFETPAALVLSVLGRGRRTIIASCGKNQLQDREFQAEQMANNLALSAMTLEQRK